MSPFIYEAVIVTSNIKIWIKGKRIKKLNLLNAESLLKKLVSFETRFNFITLFGSFKFKIWIWKCSLLFFNYHISELFPPLLFLIHSLLSRVKFIILRKFIFFFEFRFYQVKWKLPRRRNFILAQIWTIFLLKFVHFRLEKLIFLKDF